MSQALPPLNALRAFEAAARHANFARAASELHVTPGALSHQIRGLEKQLGVALFERQARGVALTPQGRLLHPGLLSGFALIRDAVQGLRATRDSGVLVVSTPPGITSKWLAPRLFRFTQAHPDIELRIAASVAYANFFSDGIDVAFRNLPHDHQADPALAYERLLEDEMVVVCSPELMASMGKARGRRDLRQVPLIHDEQLAGRPEVPTWSDWFQVSGVAAPADLRRGLRFSSAEHAIVAAVQGAGVLLTHTILAHDELQMGRLVKPFDITVPGGRAYFAVWPKLRQSNPGVQAFREWLGSEISLMKKEV